MKTKTLTAAALTAALPLAGCGASTPMSNLQTCLKHHGQITAGYDKNSFEYRSHGNPTGMTVTVYGSVQKAKAAIVPAPTLGTQVRIGKVVVLFGDVLLGPVPPNASDVRSCAS